ncbi:GT2 family glycosyltransferase [Pedobacter africanus]|uniref:GT2 family glycosyltransferase n=1 Tax=Pedobacter africanus TaxID=151894 RepID=A0ACC6L3J0_9SPHI|nr:glycosyltransferase [Pedobacter africanus]MDR6785972.1 GT2 family glycosyltransferase [Pedobacter africanus]
MSSKKFTRWVDKKDHKTCLRINQTYYSRREQGLNVCFLKHSLPKLFIKRLFYVFIGLFRFNRSPYKKYFKSPDFRHFIKRLLGLYKFEVSDLLPDKPQLKPLTFKPELNPTVSIIIAVHNHFNYTYNCLNALLIHTSNVKYEIILINDASSDNTSRLIKQIKNITYLENEENLGFLKSCNKAAAHAKGEYLCFLNNDTQVRSNWLYQMLAVFINDKQAGLVGSKLIYPYGLLQEAGSLVDNLGNPANYGKYEDPDLWQFNYLRETDYCSGASILLSKADFELLAGFDEQYAPAYYEDTDLCMAIRHQLNKKVFYQPLSQVVHFEGISSGKIVKKGSIKEYQQINAQKFKNKWAKVLNSFPITRSSVELANKFDHQKTILLIDVILPERDKASGYKRMFELMKIFKSLSFNVMFLPNNGLKTEPYFSELINMKVRVLYPALPHTPSTSLLYEVINLIDIAWISRPELNKIFAPIVKTRAEIIWAYDTVDLHFIREERGLKLQNSISEIEKELINSTMATEIQLSKDADITIAITEPEAEVLITKGAKKVKVIPNIHIPYTGLQKSFSERAGICFIGGFYHQPNIDAVLWLTNEIMPKIWCDHPEMKLTVMGSHPPPEILALQSASINVTGYVEDVTDYFTSSRVFVAPLRYGAGMKGKIGQSLEYSLPVITTDIGAEGMDLQHGHNVLIANTTDEFVKEITSLYYDEVLWNRFHLNSYAAIEKYAPLNVSKQLQEIFN